MSASIIDLDIELFWGKYNSHRIYNRSNRSVYRSNDREKSMVCPRIYRKRRKISCMSKSRCELQKEFVWQTRRGQSSTIQLS